MGMSESLPENEVFDSTGRIVNADLHNYLMATSADSPIIDSFLVDSYEPEGPFGAKEVARQSSTPAATCRTLAETPNFTEVIDS